MEKKEMPPTTVRIPTEIKQKLEEIAKKEMRSFNSQVVIALKEFIENHS